MGILFQGKDSDPDTLRGVVGTALGAASTCWESMKGTGVFNEKVASEVLGEVVAWVEANYVLAAGSTSEKKRMVRWFKNGDHPDDHVGEKAIDPVRLGELRPDLVGPNGWKEVSFEDVPEEAYYLRIEGAVVRFFRSPVEDQAGFLTHKDCGFSWHDHGWIDDGSNCGSGMTVCPGDWIVL